MPDELHRVELRGNLAGQYRENVMYWRITGATNDTPYANSAALVAWLDANITPLWLACIPPDYNLDATVARRVGPTAGQYAASDAAPGFNVGTRGVTATAEQLCPCIFTIPPMDVKSGGKIFMPAVDKADVNMNAYAAGYVTAIGNLMTAMITGGTVAGGTATLVIFSRKLNTSHSIAAFHLSTAIGFQRRRSYPVGA